MANSLLGRADTALVQAATKAAMANVPKDLSRVHERLARSHRQTMKSIGQAWVQGITAAGKIGSKLVEQAKKHRITLDDVYFLLNKDKVSNSVANQTKEDMLTQMKNVRNIPQSQSGSNNAGAATGQNASLFDSLLGLDNSIDNLFDG